MKISSLRNPQSTRGVPYMDSINEAHVSAPGLVVVVVAAADDATALAVQQLLAERWATAASQRTTRDVCEPGVRLRCYLDLRQECPRSPWSVRPRRRPGRGLRASRAWSGLFVGGVSG
jgi:hypothetical protein